MSGCSGRAGDCYCAPRGRWPESAFYLTDLCNSDGTENCPSNLEANPEEQLQQRHRRALALSPTGCSPARFLRRGVAVTQNPNRLRLSCGLNSQWEELESVLRGPFCWLTENILLS